MGFLSAGHKDHAAGDGCMMKAILDLYYATGDERYFLYVRDFLDYYINGNFLTDEYCLASVSVGKPLFDLFNITGDTKYKNVIDHIYGQLINQPKTKTGIFWHEKSQPNQVRLEGFYMIQPFFAQYEAMFNQNKNYRDVFKQFKKIYETMRDPATGLYFHGYDESCEMFWADVETGTSQNFWSASLGYYAMALVETADKLDERFFYEYMILQSYLKELLDALLVYADSETKLFYQITNESGREGNYLETSGSAAVAYAFMKGARKGYLPKYYFDYGREIFDSLVEHKLTNDGKLTDICVPAGLGGNSPYSSGLLRDGSYSYYVSEPKTANSAKGLAPFISAYAECQNRL